jgi:hypothetical protein
MINTDKYSDDDLIAILIQMHVDTHHEEANKADITKIRNTIIYNKDLNKAEQLQPIRSYFYQKNARWPSTSEYEHLLREYFEKVSAN